MATPSTADEGACKLVSAVSKAASWTTPVAWSKEMRTRPVQAASAPRIGAQNNGAHELPYAIGMRLENTSRCMRLTSPPMAPAISTTP
jgi:hypothetical protein